MKATVAEQPVKLLGIRSRTFCCSDNFKLSGFLMLEIVLKARLTRSSSSSKKALLKALATICFLLGFCQTHKLLALSVSAFKAFLK